MSLIDARFEAFVVVAMLVIVTPGPDTALVTRNALRAGWWAASLTALGVGAGSLIWALASAAGIGVVLERSVIAFTVLKLAGAIYLILLGIHSLLGSIRSGQTLAAAATGTVQRPTRRGPFVQGVLNNLLNPKAAAIFVSILPQFVRPGDAPVRLVLMLIVYEAILLLWLNIYGYLVGRAGRSRMGTQVRQVLERATAVVMIGLGARLALERS